MVTARRMIDSVVRSVCGHDVVGVVPLAFDLARWEVSAGDPLHDRLHLLRRGYARVADPDTADAGLTSAFAIAWALEVLGWENPAPPALRRCVDVIARQAAPRPARRLRQLALGPASAPHARCWKQPS